MYESEKIARSVLYESYKLFYNKEPNFKEENRRNITIEMQAMVYLIQQHYGVLIGDYRFAYNELIDLYMPISMELQDLLVSKMLNHENTEFKVPDVELEGKAKFKIFTIGSHIMETISKKENPIEALRLLSSIYHTSKSMMPSATDDKTGDFNHCSLEEVIEVKELNDAITLDLLFNRAKGYPEE